MLNHTSVDHATMREMNLALVLNTLRLNTPVSRAGLSNATGLNKATVSLIVKELLAKGFVREIGIDTTSTDVGRPAINLELDADAGCMIGAEIGVDFVSVIATDFALSVLSRRYEGITAQVSQKDVLRRLIVLLQEVYQELGTRYRRIFGISVGVPGLIDKDAGSVVFAPNLKWRHVPLRDIIAEQIDLPIYVANEAKMAAMGESYFGKGRECGFLLYIHFGVGIGGGLIMNGQMLTGASGFIGEVGHMMVQPDGLPCNCGSRGCWETLASKSALVRRIQQALAGGQKSTLSEPTDGDMLSLTVEQVVEAARGGDTVACQALDETGHWLGIGVANLTNILNPNCVIFGGPLSLAHEFLLPPMQRVASERVLPLYDRQVPPILVATHVADACVMGGVAMVHHDVLSYPLRWLT